MYLWWKDMLILFKRVLSKNKVRNYIFRWKKMLFIYVELYTKMGYLFIICICRLCWSLLLKMLMLKYIRYIKTTMVLLWFSILCYNSYCYFFYNDMLQSLLNKKVWLKINKKRNCKLREKGWEKGWENAKVNGRVNNKIMLPWK